MANQLILSSEVDPSEASRVENSKHIQENLGNPRIRKILTNEIQEKKSEKKTKNHFSKNKCEPMKHIKEFRIDEGAKFKLGEKIDVNIFNEGEYVKVSGISKGKGFAGVMKRHGFAGGRASHGKNSVMRKAGSVGAGTSPGRIWPGTRMAGRMGGDKVTVENLKVLKIDNEKNLLFIKGAVPGPSKSILYIQK